LSKTIRKDKTKKSYQARGDKLEDLRLEFTRKFSRENLENMTLEHYALNSENSAISQESFCYWVEVKLRGLGSMKGSRSDKFGVYFGKTKSDKEYKWRWTKRWPGYEQFSKLKEGLIALYDVGQNEDIEAVKKSPFSPMFKAKILSIYFPERYLNIFSEDHLHHFLNKLSIPYGKSENQIDLREKLIMYKNENPEFTLTTAIQFGHKLYDEYGIPNGQLFQDKQAEELYEFSKKAEMNNQTNKLPPKFTDTPEALPEKLSTSYGQVYRINPDKSRRAIIESNYLCEANEEHKSFIRKNSTYQYTEAHHLIPRKFQNDFQHSLDVTANIVSLCSNCHNQLHYGENIEDILKVLYYKREKRIKKVGLELSFKELKKLY